MTHDTKATAIAPAGTATGAAALGLGRPKNIFLASAGLWISSIATERLSGPPTVSAGAGA